ncbi:MAG: fructosamine kinase family protein [Flavobacteriales bacterium]|nr:fructosamine kinase family protein [Flavobacteriales bacterium]
MPLPESLGLHLETLLTDRQGHPVTIRAAHPVHGGSVNDAFRLDTDLGPLFLKTNSADQFPSLFNSEAHGLHLLRQAGDLRVPAFIAQGECDDTTFLLLEYVPRPKRMPVSRPASGGSWPGCIAIRRPPSGWTGTIMSVCYRK